MLEWFLVHGSLIAFFILANSFFVAAEFALVSVRETRIAQLIAQGRPGARTVRKLKENLDEFLPAVQFGVTLASLALGGLGEPALADAVLHVLRQFGNHSAHQAVYAHGIAVALAFAAITYFEVLLGELVPKSLALGKAERIALAVAGPMEVFIRMTRPAVRVMNVSASLVLRLFRAPLRGESSAHSPEELKMMASGARQSGLLPALQEQMIQRALELGAVSASEIMTPRGQIVSLPADLTLEQASARLVEEQHSRVPVYEPEHGPEHIIGVVYAKDVARLMHFRGIASASAGAGRNGDGASGVTLRQVMRDVLVIPETKPASEILEEFQERRRQIAIVVDEYGSTLGLVTAEDVLEQIVGEVEDEFDTGRRLPLTPSGDGFLLDGAVSLRDLVTQLRWELTREPGVETLAGLVLARLGHLPAVGESVQAEGKRFTVIAMEGRRIARVRVEPLPGAGSNQNAGALDPALPAGSGA